MKRRQMKSPPIFHERAGTSDGGDAPRQPDILREHVVIGGAIAIGVIDGVHGANVPV